MIVTPRIGLRIAAIIVVAVLLQVSFFSYVQIFGTAPDLLPAVIVCLGLLGGGVLGAVCGFAAGFVIDSILLQTLGLTSLVLLSVGYLAGRFREGFEVSNSLVPPLLAAGFTLVATSAFAALQLMLGVDAAVSVLVIRDIVIKSLIAFVLAIPTYALIRRAVRPALIDEPASARVLSRGREARRAGRRSRPRRGSRIRRRRMAA